MTDIAETQQAVAALTRDDGLLDVLQALAHERATRRARAVAAARSSGHRRRGRTPRPAACSTSSAGQRGSWSQSCGASAGTHCPTRAASRWPPLSRA